MVFWHWQLSDIDFIYIFWYENKINFVVPSFHHMHKVINITVKSSTCIVCIFYKNIICNLISFIHCRWFLLSCSLVHFMPMVIFFHVFWHVKNIPHSTSGQKWTSFISRRHSKCDFKNPFTQVGALLNWTWVLLTVVNKFASWNWLEDILTSVKCKQQYLTWHDSL